MQQDYLCNNGVPNPHCLCTFCWHHANVTTEFDAKSDLSDTDDDRPVAELSEIDDLLKN